MAMVVMMVYHFCHHHRCYRFISYRESCRTFANIYLIGMCLGALVLSILCVCVERVFSILNPVFKSSTNRQCAYTSHVMLSFLSLPLKPTQTHTHTSTFGRFMSLLSVFSRVLFIPFSRFHFFFFLQPSTSLLNINKMIASTAVTWQSDSNRTRKKKSSKFEKVCVYVIWWFDCTRCASSAQNENIEQLTQYLVGDGIWINTKCYTRFAGPGYSTRTENAWWRINGRKNVKKIHRAGQKKDEAQTHTHIYTWRQNGVWYIHSLTIRENKNAIGDVCFLFWFLPVVNGVICCNRHISTDHITHKLTNSHWFSGR